MGVVRAGFGFYRICAVFFHGLLEASGPGCYSLLLPWFFADLFHFGPLWAFLRYVHKEARRSAIVTVTPIFLRVEERTGQKKVTGIPADELEELDLPTNKRMADSIEWPGHFRQYDLPDSGVPRLPDGRPMPRILVFLMKLVKSPGITARSDTAWVQFGASLPGDELNYLYALGKKILAPSNGIRLGQ